MDGSSSGSGVPRDEPSSSSSPSPAPAGEAADAKKQRVLYASPKVVFEQSQKYARGALEHYNERNKIKLELVDAMPVNSITEASDVYTHVNFTARSGSEEEEEQLFFAELQLCSRRKASSGFVVIFCEPLLGPDFTVGQRGSWLHGSAPRKKDMDFGHCFACSSRMLHPKGETYIAGHCNIPYIYNSP